MSRHLKPNVSKLKFTHDFQQITLLSSTNVTNGWILQANICEGVVLQTFKCQSLGDKGESK